MKLRGIDLLREPFPDNQINKLPKGTKAQNECSNEQKIRCQKCGGFHHPDVIHLDFVGHAALTDRLLDADPLWSWEPFALKDGLPAIDSTGGLWIKLTVCGHTRIGYGHATASTYKEIGAREKEVIGDALRNAAMRFGAALDLWHKGELHIEEDVVENGTIPELKETSLKKGVDKDEDIPDFTPPPPTGEPSTKTPPPTGPELASSPQAKMLYALLKKRGISDEEFKFVFKESPFKLERKLVNEALKWIESYSPST